MNTLETNEKIGSLSMETEAIKKNQMESSQLRNTVKEINN